MSCIFCSLEKQTVLRAKRLMRVLRGHMLALNVLRVTLTHTQLLGSDMALLSAPLGAVKVLDTKRG